MADELMAYEYKCGCMHAQKEFQQDTMEEIQCETSALIFYMVCL